MQRINTSKATITFSCDQDWNEMKSTEKGRYCSVCTKEVIDFTRFSSEEMQRYHANNQQMCGRFLPEQVDLSLVKPISIAPHLRFFAFVSGLFFSSHTSNAQSIRTDVPKMELSTNYEPAFEETVVMPKDSITKVKATSKSTHKKPYRRKKYRVYYTKKFPFVKIVRVRHIVGKVMFVKF